MVTGVAQSHSMPSNRLWTLAMATEKETVKSGSLKYAAAKLGVSLPTGYHLIEAGKLRSYHICRAHRVSDQAIADCVSLLERESQERAAGWTRAWPTRRVNVLEPTRTD